MGKFRGWSHSPNESVVFFVNCFVQRPVVKDSVEPVKEKLIGQFREAKVDPTLNKWGAHDWHHFSPKLDKGRIEGPGSEGGDDESAQDRFH
mmetsp:Transcript_19503/g.39258  ORF Transcript_19503/g.39258 Transcript_19503/m.39258 type:complete len:91 (-) Transcript_19503:362-634(-)